MTSANTPSTSSITNNHPNHRTKNARVRRSSTGSPELNLLNDEEDDEHNEMRTRIQRTTTNNSNNNTTSSTSTITSSSRTKDMAHYGSTFAAGVGSGIASSIFCAPLDLVRTRMQVWGDVGLSSSSTTTTTSSQPTTKNNNLGGGGPWKALQEIYKAEGSRGLFRGLGATLVTVPFFWGIYFPLYEETKYTVATHFPRLDPSVVHCGSAVLTGAVADVVCNPLFVIRTRIQTQALHQLVEQQQQQIGSIRSHTTTTKTPTMVQTALELYHSSNHGMRIFWRGMSANLMGLSHVAIQFPTYEYFKSLARDKRQDRRESVTDLLLASGAAKMCASLISYPHEVLRSRMMDSRATTAPTLVGTLQTILAQEGWKGLYRGLPVTLLRVIPNCCITFLTYEYLKRWSQDQLASMRRW